ncbi:fimbria/pilus outer membrane usher protein [Roseicella aerolata]|uniref:Fimbria/pilus outer membrane usher protein n=1 Tax=Roseicella aerolata TaxID=2883479 RepID=A0A9X1IFF6_9PROT|nr:fimbria/pilus outer membrane usher protein [Roseicella aerolata]MCB4823542.1 fimbria/pilus outer membrane usher protein [Roseicella aerolata]
MLLLALAFLPFPVQGAERRLQLEVRINGRPTGLVGEFVERAGALFARGRELRELGVEAPEDDALVPLASIPGLGATLDPLTQVLEVSADPAALRRTSLNGRGGRTLPPLTPTDWGIVLNYDTLGTFGTETTGFVQNEQRLLGPYGTLSNSALSRFGVRAPDQDYVRLDSNWSYADPDQDRNWRLGDLVTGAVGWSRAIRLGGGQVASDFNMRPDLVRFGSPSFTGLAALPSTVDVLVNGVRQFGSPVPPGPFEIRNLPVVVSGGSEVVVAVRDELGRQTLTTLPFYYSTQLLAEGTTSYSVQAGRVRLGYGIRTTDYVGWAASGSARHGLKQWLTAEGHAEATDGLAMAGGGGAVRLGSFGVASLALAASAGRGASLPREITERYGVLGKATTGPGRGGQVAFGLQHSTSRYSLTLSGTFASAGFRDTAALFGTSVVRSQLRASVSLPLQRYGSLTLGFIQQRGGVAQATPLGGIPLGLQANNALLNLGYSVSLRDDLYFYASGFYDLRGSLGTGIFAGLIFTFGAKDSAGLSYNRQDRSNTYTAQLVRPAVQTGDIGGRLVAELGDVNRQLAEGQYLGPYGRVTAGMDLLDGQPTGRFGLGGSAVIGGGSAFLSDRIFDSFAVVRTGSVPGVPVQYENRPAGTTRRDGRLLVPQLRSFDVNRLSIDPVALPADVEVSSTQQEVRPGDRAGIVVDFGIRRSLGALVRFQLPDGRPVPTGSAVRKEGQPPVPVGGGGRAYLTGLEERNRVAIALPDGTTCQAGFGFTPLPGEIPLIGPVGCE